MTDDSRNNKPIFPLTRIVEEIKTREDLISFVKDLVDDFRNSPSDCENKNLDIYLEAISAWIQDMDGYYENMGKSLPQNINWKVIGQILLAAKYYE